MAEFAIRDCLTRLRAAKGMEQEGREEREDQTHRSRSLNPSFPNFLFKILVREGRVSLVEDFGG